MATSDSRKRATKKYNLKAYQEIKVRVHTGKKEKIIAFAKANGETLNGFINRLISEAIGWDLDNDTDGCHGANKNANADKDLESE